MTFSYRKTWRCGEKYVDGELTIDLDNGCGQDIYQSNTEKFQSGKYMILNLKDGEGGYAGMKHVCPNRVGSKFHHVNEVNMREYDYHQRNFPCSCGAVYNKEVFPICPSHMRLECRQCGNLQHWVASKGISCFRCGGQCDPRSVKFMETVKQR
jgi:hypothetical protein